MYTVGSDTACERSRAQKGGTEQTGDGTLDYVNGDFCLSYRSACCRNEMDDLQCIINAVKGPTRARHKQRTVAVLPTSIDIMPSKEPATTLL